jgi:hypothetical protein
MVIKNCELATQAAEFPLPPFAFVGWPAGDEATLAAFALHVVAMER